MRESNSRGNGVGRAPEAAQLRSVYTTSPSADSQRWMLNACISAAVDNAGAKLPAAVPRTTVALNAGNRIAMPECCSGNRHRKVLKPCAALNYHLTQRGN